jgi:hypothetical protein
MGPKYTERMAARGIETVEQLTMAMFKPTGGGRLAGDRDLASEFLRVRGLRWLCYLYI